MNRTLFTALVGTGALIVGVTGTAVVYESSVVSRLNSEIRGAEAAALYLHDSLDKAESAVEACQSTVDAISDTMTGYSDAYSASREAINNFFDRYNFAAGDADYLYASLYIQDDAVSSAASNLSSVTDGDVTDCVSYSR